MAGLLCHPERGQDLGDVVSVLQDDQDHRVRAQRGHDLVGGAPARDDQAGRHDAADRAGVPDDRGGLGAGLHGQHDDHVRVAQFRAEQDFGAVGAAQAGVRGGAVARLLEQHGQEVARATADIDDGGGVRIVAGDDRRGDVPGEGEHVPERVALRPVAGEAVVPPDGRDLLPLLGHTRTASVASSYSGAFSRYATLS
jgi:hypothetical protein